MTPSALLSAAARWAFTLLLALLSAAAALLLTADAPLVLILALLLLFLVAAAVVRAPRAHKFLALYRILYRALRRYIDRCE